MQRLLCCAGPDLTACFYHVPLLYCSRGLAGAQTGGVEGEDSSRDECFLPGSFLESRREVHGYGEQEMSSYARGLIYRRIDARRFFGACACTLPRFRRALLCTGVRAAYKHGGAFVRIDGPIVISVRCPCGLAGFVVPCIASRQQIKTVFVGLFYSAIVPTGLLVTAVAMQTLYWVDKYSLMRLWRRPPVRTHAARHGMPRPAGTSQRGCPRKTSRLPTLSRAVLGVLSVFFFGGLVRLKQDYSLSSALPRCGVCRTSLYLCPWMYQASLLGTAPPATAWGV